MAVIFEKFVSILEMVKVSMNIEKRILIGTFVGPSPGSGKLLQEILSAQQGVACSLENRPLLPWEPDDSTVMERRFQRFRNEREATTIADLASFYLPYLPAAFESDSTLKVIHLTVPQDETVERFEQLLNARHAVPVHHWLQTLSVPWCHDFDWSRTYPKYDIYDRTEAIRRYWTEYEEGIDALVDAFGDRVLRISRDELLTEEGGGRVLDFCEIPEATRQARVPVLRPPSAIRRHPRSGVSPLVSAIRDGASSWFPH